MNLWRWAPVPGDTTILRDIPTLYICKLKPFFLNIFSSQSNHVAAKFSASECSFYQNKFRTKTRSQFY